VRSARKEDRVKALRRSDPFRIGGMVLVVGITRLPTEPSNGLDSTSSIYVRLWLRSDSANAAVGDRW
jgi:hypothetical protein